MLDVRSPRIEMSDWKVNSAALDAIHDDSETLWQLGRIYQLRLNPA